MIKPEKLLRSMAWERAKGELRSILGTYDYDDGDRFTSYKNKLDEFIKEIEDESLTE